MADHANNALKRSHPEGDESMSQKRARSNHGSPAPANPTVDINKKIAEAKAKAEAVRARLQERLGSGTPPASPMESSPTPPAPPPVSSGMSKLEQMKAKIAAAAAKRSNPPSNFDDDSQAHGGLYTGLHPALSEPTPDFSQSRQDNKTGSQARRGKQLDLSGPSIEEIKNNPYYDPSLGPKAKPRASRPLVFNPQGKYIQQGSAIRRQEQLEAMKRRIAERARQAGIDEDPDVDKGFLVPEPPAIEWWDECLVNGDSYDATDNPANLKIGTPDSLVTHYIQHPIQLAPPQDSLKLIQKPMYLTKKEQAKVRRQRRMADLKEEQAKIRLGLVPAPPPKVKKSNLMRVLGEQAVKDPTAVEARVTQEIEERRLKHEAENAARKLTKEQRREKLASQQEKDAAMGIYVSVYRIDSLANGRNRFKINKNAEQNKLTGICVLNPKMNLVIVEGGKHSVNNYRKLMLNRIDWTDNPGPSPRISLTKTEDEKGEPRDFSQNSCDMIWQGQAKARVFRKWLGDRICETEADAKETLSRTKMDNFWNLARSFKQGQAMNT
ncbi:hypothetical protein N7470_009581 [Penicillium chermesinum]|nr:hypothetical protein N7470_009581 [Penicillium chermesinum]